MKGVPEARYLPNNGEVDTPWGPLYTGMGALRLLLKITLT